MPENLRIVHIGRTPHAAVWAATELVRPGGTVVLVGTGAESMPLSVRGLIHQEITVKGSAAHLWDIDVARPSPRWRPATSTPTRCSPTSYPSNARSLTASNGWPRDTDTLKILIDCT